MSKPTDIRIVGTTLFFLPVRTRVPLKFGSETLTEVTCARVRVLVMDQRGERAEGWGETPLSAQWVWPSALPLPHRAEALKAFCVELARTWAEFTARGHPMEIGLDFQEQVLPELLAQTNAARGGKNEAMPWLAALVCCSAFDIALHDAFGQLSQQPIYETYNAKFMNRDLGMFLEVSPEGSFAGKFPKDFLLPKPPLLLRALHQVGGLDLLDASELKGDEPNDGHPVLPPDWIGRDGLKCLKIKLRGTDGPWDLERVIRVGKISVAYDVAWLSVDFN